jgi:hypothetical protein
LNYNKTKKIIWTLEADACFDLVKSEVAKCTAMHFLDDHAPISLQLMHLIMVWVVIFSKELMAKKSS